VKSFREECCVVKIIMLNQVVGVKLKDYVIPMTLSSITEVLTYYGRSKVLISGHGLPQVVRSVAGWLGYFFNIGHLQQSKFDQQHKIFAQIG